MVIPFVEDLEVILIIVGTYTFFDMSKDFPPKVSCDVNLADKALPVTCILVITNTNPIVVEFYQCI